MQAQERRPVVGGETYLHQQPVHFVIVQLHFARDSLSINALDQEDSRVQSVDVSKELPQVPSKLLQQVEK